MLSKTRSHSNYFLVDVVLFVAVVVFGFVVLVCIDVLLVFVVFNDNLKVGLYGIVSDFCVADHVQIWQSVVLRH